MNTAIVVRNAHEVRLIHWAARIAQARKQGLVLLWAPPSRSAKTKRTSTREGGELPEELGEVCRDLQQGEFMLAVKGDDVHDEPSAADEPLSLEVVTVSSEQLPLSVESEIDQLSIDCLVVPREPQLRSGSAEAALYDHLLSHVPCDVIFLTAGSNESGECRTIVTPVAEGPHSDACLRMANEIAQVCDSQLVALHVEPELDITARQAAERILAQTVDRALGSEQDLVTQKVVLSDSVVEGIKSTLNEPPDLLILGMPRPGFVRRYRWRGVADKLVNSNPAPTIAVLRSAMPLSNRIGHKIDTLRREFVPQMPRDQRVTLVETIQRSSRWDFDFIMLTCMSTLLAAGGLIQNSSAVVIGAMLVAPLMTPLLGAGLSLTQGNLIFFRSTLLTVLRGFLLAFVISFVAGALASSEPTDEMLTRGSPRVLDILVAAVSGMAAAYASCRANLLSALPGVAIAASLVPPIATSGIALWQGEIGLAVGSALLFFTNIVAIVLGTWFAFHAVGIKGTHEHGDFDRWTLLAGASLVVLIVTLGVIESLPARDASVSGMLQARINATATTDRWECMGVDVQGNGDQRNVRVHINSSTPSMPKHRLDRIQQVITESFDQAPNVTFVTTQTDY